MGKPARKWKWSVGAALVLLVLLAAGAAWFVREVRRFKLKARQPEATANLKACFSGQRAYFAERDTFIGDIAAIGFAPEPGNRYAYFLAPEGPVLRPAQLANSPAGVEPGYVVLANDAARFETEEVRSFAQTGCPITPGRDAAGREIRLGVTPGEKGGFVFLAAGKLRREDRRLDCWSISSMPRQTASGERIAAGQPFNEFNGILGE